MPQFIMQHLWIIYALIIWTLPWKGIALWRAAKNRSKVWFIIIFLINTLSVLDIIYVVFLSGKKEDVTENKNEPKILSNGTRIV